MALSGNPIIITAASTWVTTGDVTMNIAEILWRGITTDGHDVILSRDTSATAASGQITARKGFANVPMTLWSQTRVLSKLYVHTLDSGKLEIWLD